MKIPFTEPFSVIDFSAINYENLINGLTEAIKQASQEVNLIAQSADEPTFENTIEALESAGQQVDIISAIIFNLNHAHSNPIILEAAKEAAPLLSHYSNDVMLNSQLFQRIEAVYHKAPSLDSEGQMLLQKTYKDFVRNGAKLEAEQKQQLRAIDSRLSELSVIFGEHVLNETKAYELFVENESDLEGVPERVLVQAAALAQSKGKSGWCFTLFAPSYVPFVTYCPNRELRREIMRAYASRAITLNPPVLTEIMELRVQRAKLLGYETYADFVLEQRMAASKDNVIRFLDELKEAARPYALQELAQMQQLASTHGIDTLQPWDWPFFAEKIKSEKFSIDQEQLRAYFLLDNVLNGIFHICGRLFDLEFLPDSRIPAYQEDVLVYEVRRKGQHIGVLYLDLFSRQSKSPGTWKTNFRSPKQGVAPLVSIVCNFTDSKPTLLSFEEVWTLFHEFGHALHALLSECRYQSLAGTNTTWDFVELPSQLFENWCAEPEPLSLFAKHYQTGEPLENSVIEKIKEMSRFQQGYATMRQLGFAYLDMACHSLGALPEDFEVERFEQEHLQDVRVLTPIPGTAVLPSFSHIFNGGYAAGYYSYKWAEVLEANAYEYFREQGFLNPQAGEHLRATILSKGGSQKALDLFVAFKGHEPRVKALIDKLFS